MRYWQAILPVLAAAGISAPAAAGSDVYVPIAHSPQVFVLLQIPGEMPQARPVRHASQFADGLEPSTFTGVLLYPT